MLIDRVQLLLADPCTGDLCGSDHTVSGATVSVISQAFCALLSSTKRRTVVPGAQRLWQLSALADPDKRPIPSRKWPFVKYEGLY